MAPPVAVVATAGLVDVRSSSRFPSAPILTLLKAFWFEKTLICAQQIDQRAEAHVRKQDFGGFGSLLARFVDFRRGHRFGEGQLGILHHHSPQQGNEKNAKRAADDHQHHRIPVLIGGEAGPESG